MKRDTIRIVLSVTILLLFVATIQTNAQQLKVNSYQSFLQLCKELRLLESTNLPNGVPDYRSATIIQTQQTLLKYKIRLQKIDTTGWAVSQKVDYVLLRAEMNALDYNCRILKPWTRDPAFYVLVFNEQSDTPDHEGPTIFGAIELWNYAFPLSMDHAKKLTGQLKIIPPLYEQAKINLTGNARDLWSAGIGDIKGQMELLDELSKKTNNDYFELKNAIATAKQATLKLIDWLQKELQKKTGHPELVKKITPGICAM